ncbi:MAG: tetratricopeptide repeat protein [Ignavibacteria bacterium]|nr:tetratricopeptide repeat protein [Ignavibacteria bacterium]
MDEQSHLARIFLSSFPSLLKVVYLFPMTQQNTFMTILFRCFIAFSFIIVGCKTTQPPAQKTTDEQQEKPRIKNKDLAVQHFIAGSVYDTKEDYARAALEYQEALQYDDDASIFYALSRDYAQLNKKQLAVQNAYEAVVRDTSNRDYRENLAQIYLAQFSLDSAIMQYHEIVKRDSDYVQGWYSLANAVQFQSSDSALVLYRKIIERFGSQWEIWERIAMLSIEKKKYDDAAFAYKEMLALDPSNNDLKITLASAYEFAGKESLACELYKKIAAETDNENARIAAARILLLLHQYSEADSLIQPLLQQDSVSFETKLKIGEAYIDALHKDSTLIDFVQNYFLNLKNEQPEDWRSYWYLAAIALSQDSVSSAIENYEKVNELADWNIDAWINLASIYSEQKKFSLMAETLERVQKKNSNDFRINFFLGIAYYRDGKLEKAIDPLERALQLRPTEMNVLSTLALIYDALKRWDDSDRLYETALKIDANNHLLLNNYGYSLSVRGEQLPRALEMSKKALEQQPKNPSYLDTMGWVYFRLGNFDEAKKYIQDAINVGDASAEVNEHMGDVYFKLNDTAKAVEYWKKAVDLDSTRESAKDKIRKGGL